MNELCTLPSGNRARSRQNRSSIRPVAMLNLVRNTQMNKCRAVQNVRPAYLFTNNAVVEDL